MSGMVRFFLNPFNLFWLLMIATMIIGLFKKERLFRWLFFSTVVWFLIISTPFLPVSLLNSLEIRYNPIFPEEAFKGNSEIDKKYHIVVLGGGHGFDERLPPNSILSSQALARLIEGIRLHRQLPGSKLVLSGYSSSGRTTQAERLQQTAILLGVEADDILLQKEPANTWQEAETYASTFGNGNPVLLVTCASHMHRAVRVFEHFGTKVTPSPACYRILRDPRSRRSWIPSTTNIDRLRIALFEYAAILRDKLRMKRKNSERN